jgi:hypothetical protein
MEDVLGWAEGPKGPWGEDEVKFGRFLFDLGMDSLIYLI